MRSLRTKLKRLAIVALVLAIALLVSYFAFLPTLAHRLVERALRNAGIDATSFIVDDVSLSNIIVSEIELGAARWGSAGRISAEYSLGSLWSGRVESLRIDQATWRWTVRDGRIDVGPILTGDGRAADWRAVPFDRLILRHLALLIDEGNDVRRLNVNATISRAAGHIFDADMSISPSEGPFLIGAPSFEVAAVGTQLKLRLQMLKNGVDIRLREPGTLGLEQVATALAGGRLETSATQTLISQITGKPLARLSQHIEGMRLSMDAQLQPQTAVHVEAPQWRAFVPNAIVVVSINLAPEQNSIISTDIAITGATIRSDAVPLLMTGVNAVIPIDFNRAASRTGPVTVGAVVWRDLNLPGFTGSIGLPDRSVIASIDWPAISGAMLSASAAVDFRNGRQGEITASIPAFRLTDAAIIRELVPHLRTAELGGTYAVEARFTISGDRIDPFIHITGNNALVRRRDWPLQIDAASGEVTITGLAPFSTLPRQRIVVHQGQAGTLPITEGEVTLGVDQTGRVAVNDVQWNMGAFGEYRATPFSFDPANPVIHTELSSTNVGLGEWLSLLSNKRAGGEGILAGKFALTIQPGHTPLINIREGSLAANPPTGRTHIRDAATISRLLEKSTLGTDTDPRVRDVQNRAVEALLDFQYSQLAIEFVPEQASMVCRITTAGKGRQGDPPQEIGSLTINIRNFNELFNQAMFLGRVLSFME